jgi:cyclic pyranopterin phosphate synthase
VVGRAEIVERLGAVHPLEPVGRTDGAPAERFRFADGRGEIGVIPTVTDAFCDTCDRVRLTAEGQLRNCLFAVDESDLRALLRGGGDDGAVDGAIADAVAASVAGKWAGHLINQPVFIRPTRSMSQIGG